MKGKNKETKLRSTLIISISEGGANSVRMEINEGDRDTLTFLVSRLWRPKCM